MPGVSTPASDETLFVRTDWMDKNAAQVDTVVAEFARLWREMAANPAIIEAYFAARKDIQELCQNHSLEKRLPVERYVTPEEFAEWKKIGESMGFKHVESAPLVRSSYHAWEQVQAAGV